MIACDLYVLIAHWQYAQGKLYSSALPPMLWSMVE